jgi:hypothetical protein
MVWRRLYVAAFPDMQPVHNHTSRIMADLGKADGDDEPT